MACGYEYEYIGSRTVGHPFFTPPQPPKPDPEPESNISSIWEDYDDCGEGWDLTRDEESGDIYIGVSLECGYTGDQISLSKILNILKEEGIDYETLLDNHS